MRNTEKDMAEMAAKRQRILESGFRLFANRGISGSTMNEVAAEAKVGIATLYRYFANKTELVLAIGTLTWEKQLDFEYTTQELEAKTAAEIFDLALSGMVSMYTEHRDVLRFNQFFNIYMNGVDVKTEEIKPYIEMIEKVKGLFHKLYVKGEKDGTLKTEISEELMFTSSLHLMLAVLTRYAVGLIYKAESSRVEQELILQKNMLLKEYTYMKVQD